MFLNSLSLPVAYSKIKEKAGLKVGQDQRYIFHIQPKQIWEKLFRSQRLNETLLIHLNRNKTCSELFSEDELSNLSKEAKTRTKKKYYEKNKTQIKQKYQTEGQKKAKWF